jgi:acylphosphatase
MMETKKRAHVWISGRVQGVFFRAETKRAAEAQGITGWVRNLGDGRVEAVFEGSESDVRTMVDWCWKGSPRSSVQQVETVHETFSGDFDSFDVVK